VNQSKQPSLRSPLAPGHPNDVSTGSPLDSNAISSSSRRVLVVDDNEDSAKILGMLLECVGLQVRVENNGPAALGALDDFRPHAVLMDLGMPGMDGFEVARRIRDGRQYDSIVLIALTGWGQPEDQLRSTAAGFNHHLVKPVDLAALETLLVTGDSSAS
jgi:CheY-like chemotaxis protein